MRLSARKRQEKMIDLKNDCKGNPKPKKLHLRSYPAMSLILTSKECVVTPRGQKIKKNKNKKKYFLQFPLTNLAHFPRSSPH